MSRLSVSVVTGLEGQTQNMRALSGGVGAVKMGYTKAIGKVEKRNRILTYLIQRVQ